MIEEDLFHRALEKQTFAEQLAFLEQACADQPELRERVERLLRSHRHEDSFLHGGVTRDEPSAERPGMAIGPYKLLEKLGEGGMGTVWMAQQTEPVKRLIALKLIKLGMDSKQVIARFEAERQALALMDHPNIAKVFDGGAIGASVEPSGRRDSGEPRRADASTLAWGRPYFVMELVKGVPITKYCDEHRLTPRQRLELFIPICQAVQHAHQKGIIHRDLKPSNVLIALYDGKPVPKVIDFGVAKAAGQPLTEQTLVTGFGAIVGTLEYMSPEQAEINQLDIDTRSDIYSLGVLLYELLTGSPPFSRKELEKAGMLEMLRVIREQEPSKPSTKLSTAEGLPTLAANRGTEPAKLTKLVRGELDWIVMKALEKDRSRRYDTANGFAMDVQRYLADEPVQACPPSVGYRLRKFVRRNRLQVIAGTLVFSALLIGLSVSVWGLIRADAARRDAVAAENDAQERRRAAEVAEANEAKQRKIAVAEAELANEVKEFLRQDVLRLANPADQHGERTAMPYDATVQLRDVILRAAEKIEGKFKDRPLVEIDIRRTLAYALSGMDRQDLAVKHYERLLALRTEYLGADHIDTLLNLASLAMCYSDLGRIFEGLTLIERAYPLIKAKLGPDDPRTLWAARSLGSSYYEVGRLNDALAIREETAALSKAKLGSDHQGTVNSMSDLASSYADAGRYAEAKKLREEAFATCKAKLGLEHPDTLRHMSALASSFANVGRYAEALKLREETLALAKIKLGVDHRSTFTSMGALASSFADVGRYAEALKLREETLTLRKAKLGVDHPHALASMNDLASIYEQVERHADALKLREETLALRKIKFGLDHPSTLRSMSALTTSYRNARRYAEALTLSEETLTLSKNKLGVDHPDTLRCMSNLACSYADVSRIMAAFKLHEETLAKVRLKFGEDHPETLRNSRNLASGHFDLGRFEEAKKLYEETLERHKAKLGHDHRDTLRCAFNLALTYFELDRLAEALKLHEQTLELRKIKLGTDHPDTLRSMLGLSVVHFSMRKYDVALKLRQEAFDLSKVKLGVDHSNTLSCMHHIANCFEVLGRLDDALKLREETLATRKAKLGADHLDTVESMHNLAISYSLAGRDAEALKLREKVLALYKDKLGDKHLTTLDAVENLANSYTKLGRAKSAIVLRKELLTLRKEVCGPEHAHTLVTMHNLAVDLGALGNHEESWKLHVKTFELRKVKLTSGHPDTHRSMYFVASSLIKLGRGDQAIAIIDELLKLTKGTSGNPKAFLSGVYLRMQHFQKANDLAGVLATVDLNEKMDLRDSDLLYNAACFRAIAAAMQAKTSGADAQRLPKEHADKAMAWLTKAVAAGFSNRAHMEKDTDLDYLRDRDDFKKLLGSLPSSKPKTPPK